MVDYSTQVAELIRQTRAAETAIGMRNPASYSRFFVHSQPSDPSEFRKANRVLLFFHGFTSVPQQFVPIAKAFFRAGYNVLIPRLPGHGYAGNWNRNNPPPLPSDVSTYQQFALEWLNNAQIFGNKVVVGGLSGGGNLAAWLSFERPEVVDRALLFAPYLGNTNAVLDWLIRSLKIYFKWKPEPGTHHFGYEGFYMPALKVWLDLGDIVLKQAESQPSVPTLVISSQFDRAVSLSQQHRLFQASLKSQPKSWYVCFNEKLNIAHNMMTEEEGNARYELVIAIAKAYVESELTWEEAQPQIKLVEQGKWNYDRQDHFFGATCETERVPWVG